MLQYLMASSKTVKIVWFELDPKKYSVEDHPIAKHFLDWTRESEAVTKEKYKKSDYLTDGFTLVSLAAPCASGGGGAASSFHQNSLPTAMLGVATCHSRVVRRKKEWRGERARRTCRPRATRAPRGA